MTITNRVSLKSVMAGVTPIADVPDAPTIGAATNVGTSRAYNNGSATVAYTAAPTGGTVTTFTATSTPGSFTGTGTSPITVTGLQSATSYTFTVSAANSNGTLTSGSSSSITATTVPQAPTIGTFTDGGTGTTGTLSFTAGATGGSTITGYKYSTDGTTYISASGTTSPLSLTGLTAGTYTFTLKATNANGDSAASSGVSGTVIQPTAYEFIAASVGASGTVVFSSIPNTYKSLQLRVSAISTIDGATYGLRLNNDYNDANYRTHLIRANGASVFSQNYNASYLTVTGLRTTYPTGMVIDIHDYASTSKAKVVKSFVGSDTSTEGSLMLISNRWNNTGAINRIDLFGVNIAAGSQVSLYGVN